MKEESLSPSNSVVLIGCGQIGKSQHAPVLKSRPHQFRLVAIVDPLLSKRQEEEEEEIPVFCHLSSALAAISIIDTAIIACPPHFAQDYAEEALRNNLNVMMEKPPGIDHKRLLLLQELALQQKVTLYTAYHSTKCPHMKHAKEWITASCQNLKCIHIEWKESAAKWHSNQDWITRVGFGVLDILCNPISMLDELLLDGNDTMKKMAVERSRITIPSNWLTPIEGCTVLKRNDSLKVYCDYAWNHDDSQDIWSIKFETVDGHVMELSKGGAQMSVDGVEVKSTETETNDILRPEYEALYDRFVELLEHKESEVRTTPLGIICDILQQSERVVGEEYKM